MSTRRQTDWGTPDVRGDDPAVGSSPSGASGALYGLLQSFVRMPGFGKLIPKGRAGDLSQGATGGIDIDRINRATLGPLKGQTTGNYTVSGTTFTDLDSQRLSGTMACTGRPVRIDISLGANIGSSTGVIFSAAMDGTEVTGVYDGMAWTYTGGDEWLAGWAVITPPAGLHRFSLVAKCNTAASSSTVYAGALDIVQIFVCEL